jgi:predicted Fe-S protein YdhL (DUF1289 family)
MTTQLTPASPCINVCVLDHVSRTCTGCGRTIDEIARWGGMSAAEQWQVVARLERERVQAGAQAARVTATRAG